MVVWESELSAREHGEIRGRDGPVKIVDEDKERGWRNITHRNTNEEKKGDRSRAASKIFWKSQDPRPKTPRFT